VLNHTTAVGIHQEKQRALRKVVGPDKPRERRRENTGLMAVCSEWIISMADSFSFANRQARPAE
jgi:hypothetical protein